MRCLFSDRLLVPVRTEHETRHQERDAANPKLPDQKNPASGDSPTTRRGVSAANCVAGMLTPARQPLMVRRARKYSCKVVDATRRAQKPEKPA